MEPELEEVSHKFAWLNFACARGEFASCAALLLELKVLLTKFTSLPPSFEKTPNAVQELKIARAIYEQAVILSIKVKDQDAFKRNFCQLKSFYMDARGMIVPSPDEYPIVGLNLLSLLAENRIAEFHVELELLSPEALGHSCIRYVLDLERSFMEGTYNRLSNACQAVPHEAYVFFMDHLAATIRDEIADCSVHAYDYLSVPDARKMLIFTSDQELLEYISKAQPEWDIKNRSVLCRMAKPKSRMHIHALQQIKRIVSYAQELVRIV
ncbi:hypothetical protein ABZP36_007132 [Zizania latifolia]